MSSTPTATPTLTPVFIDLPEVRLVIFILLVAAIAVAVERIITNYLSKFSARAGLQAYTINNLILLTRILILIFAIAIITNIGGIPPEWLLGVSAIGGAALGFASQKTLGNFLAGLFLLMSRPFKVGDYVRVGTVEGVVKEITINYAKIFTAANNTVSVSNLQILDRDITNFAYDKERVGRLPGFYCYTFELGFDHSVSSDKLNAIFDSICRSHLTELPKAPDCMLIRSGAFERTYLFYLYVRKTEDIFRLRPIIADEIYTLWDRERKAEKPSDAKRVAEATEETNKDQKEVQDNQSEDVQ
jgi:small-conductance mechanosensitive channel